MSDYRYELSDCAKWTSFNSTSVAVYLPGKRGNALRVKLSNYEYNLEPWKQDVEKFLDLCMQRKMTAQDMPYKSCSLSRLRKLIDEWS